MSYVIRAIEHDSQIVPRDSYRVTPEHELRPNVNFYGVQRNKAIAHSSWQHFRAPSTAEARKVMDDEMVVFSTGFLDTVESDKPQGSWSI